MTSYLVNSQPKPLKAKNNHLLVSCQIGSIWNHAFDVLPNEIGWWMSSWTFCFCCSKTWLLIMIKLILRATIQQKRRSMPIYLNRQWSRLTQVKNLICYCTYFRQLQTSDSWHLILSVWSVEDILDTHQGKYIIYWILFLILKLLHIIFVLLKYSSYELKIFSRHTMHILIFN